MRTSHWVLHDAQTSRTRVPLGDFDIDRGRLRRCYTGSDAASTTAAENAVRVCWKNRGVFIATTRRREGLCWYDRTELDADTTLASRHAPVRRCHNARMECTQAISVAGALGCAHSVSKQGRI